MKKFYFLFLVIVLIFTGCGSHKTTAYSKSEPVCIASEMDGSYTLRVEGRGRNAVDAYKEAGKQAIYALLFTDVRMNNGPQKMIQPVFYMKRRAYENNQAYFDTFFKDNGEYTKYISMKENRSLSSIYTKTNSQTVCVTTVCVYISKLKEKFVEDGIL